MTKSTDCDKTIDNEEGNISPINISMDGLFTNPGQPVLIANTNAQQSIVSGGFTTNTPFVATKSQGFTSFTSGVATVETAGIYFLSYRMVWLSNVTGFRSAFFIVNGSTASRYAFSRDAAVQTNTTIISSATILDLQAGDTVELIASHDAGINLVCGGTGANSNAFKMALLF